MVHIKSAHECDICGKEFKTIYSLGFHSLTAKKPHMIRTPQLSLVKYEVGMLRALKKVRNNLMIKKEI